MHIFLGLIFTAVILLLSYWLIGLRSKDKNRRRVLQLLLDHPDSYGLQLQDLSRGKLGVGVYVTLRLLEDEGLLTSRRDHRNTATRGGRPRVRYTLTERGREEAERLRDQASPR